MDKQEEKFPDKKMENPNAHNKPQSSPGPRQRSDTDGNTERSIAPGGVTERRPGMVSSQQPVKSLRTEPLSPERSEERRVGKECRYGGSTAEYRGKTMKDR